MSSGLAKLFLRFCFCICCLWGPLTLSAQEKEDEDLDKYFDDGGLSTRKNILSTNFLAPVSGVLGLRYERAIGKHFSLELGVYKLMPFYIYELLLPINVYFSDFDPKSGFGYSVAPHYFFSGEAPEFHYIGPRYGWRKHILQDGSTMAVHDFTLDYGYNLFLSKHFMFCYDIGMGYRRMILDSNIASGGTIHPLEKRGTTFMFWSIGLGVMF